jgi:hypothetical protein
LLGGGAAVLALGGLGGIGLLDRRSPTGHSPSREVSAQPGDEKRAYPYLRIEGVDNLCLTPPTPPAGTCISWTYPPDVRYIVRNDGNLPAWTCYVESYMGEHESDPISACELVEQEIIVIQPGEQREVRLNWKPTCGGRVLREGFVIGICYDPLMDPLGPRDSILVGSNDRHIARACYSSITTICG